MHPIRYRFGELDPSLLFKPPRVLSSLLASRSAAMEFSPHLQVLRSDSTESDALYHINGKVLTFPSSEAHQRCSRDAHKTSLPHLLRVLVHVLPREFNGKSTFELAVRMLKWLPLWLVDNILLIMAWIAFGSLEKYGLKSPIGPLELKKQSWKNSSFRHWCTGQDQSLLNMLIHACPHNSSPHDKCPMCSSLPPPISTLDGKPSATHLHPPSPNLASKFSPPWL
ncbi:unnamed protein product [Rhodiola kirilowii]